MSSRYYYQKQEYSKAGMQGNSMQRCSFERNMEGKWDRKALPAGHT